MLLLMMRRALPRKPSARQVDAILSRLQTQAYGAIVSIRQTARFAGLSDVAGLIGFGRVELAETLADTSRAKRIAGNLAKHAGQKLSTGSSLVAIDKRIELIAITENAQAFNEQRRNAVLDFAAKRDVRLVEIWDATLDKRTCEVCMGLDGSESIDGEGFDGGQVPGAVHPMCRCTSHFQRIH